MGSAKRWSYKAGEKGRNRVRVFERDSAIYVEFYARDPETGQRKRRRKSTGHRDRDRAKQQADEIAAKLASTSADRDAGLTLRKLFDKYLEKRTPQVSEGQQKHHHRCADMFARYWGWEREVESLNRGDWDDFIQARGGGAIGPRGRDIPQENRQPIGSRRVQEDLQNLRAVCNWAVQADLLERNPVDGYPLPKEENPSRPHVSQERYEAMLEVAGEVDWRFEVALILANETGHRSKAIRRLRWSDVDLAEERVLWRGAENKTANEHVTSLTEPAVGALRRAQKERAAIGEAWVLPAPRDSSKPVSRHLLQDWWERAEKLAELDPVDGLKWHGLRRKFATEHLKAGTSSKVVAHMGGWQSVQTLQKCYQKVDSDAVREAQERREALREGAAGGQ